MSQSSAPSDRIPDAEQIGTRFLQLLGGLHRRDDLSLARLEQATGVALKPGGGGPFYTRDLQAGWYYLLNYVEGSGAVKRGVGLEFGHRGDAPADPRPICSLSFQDYHQRLRALGFSDEPNYGEIGQLIDWRYRKGDLTVAVVPWPQDPADAKAPVCVKSIATLN
ncbi:hypothetical protein [Lysobacter enzymogenes]|uniref:hypothetical protein n=1 Tax=Lysobacter enzymogenes TaxID=69 RepID=UPI001A9735E4|nr:hypothetical protein [Lysobacter enzymogenes]QQP98692.1 hypothetical protein JHW38_12215 [Lysobacter enzymogenes]